MSVELLVELVEVRLLGEELGVIVGAVGPRVGPLVGVVGARVGEGVVGPAVGLCQREARARAERDRGQCGQVPLRLGT